MAKLISTALELPPNWLGKALSSKPTAGNLRIHLTMLLLPSPSSLKGLQLVVDQYQRDRTSAQPTDVGASGGSEMLGQEKAAMVIEGNWVIPYFKETFPKLEFATAEVPTINGKSGTMAFTVAYVMNRKTKHKQAAWKLIEYLTGKVGMKAWATQGLALPSPSISAGRTGLRSQPTLCPVVLEGRSTPPSGRRARICRPFG